MAPSRRSQRMTKARSAALHHVMQKSPAPRQSTMFVVRVVPSQTHPPEQVERMPKPPPLQQVERMTKVDRYSEVVRAQKTASDLPTHRVISKMFRDELPPMSWKNPTALHHTVVLSPPRPQPTSADAQPLTAAERDFLHEHGGVPRNTTNTTPGLPQPQRVTVLGTPEVAERLHVSDTTVNRRAHTNRLLAYPIRGRLMFPRWQFTSDGEPVAGLEVALSALPRDWGPYRIERFFTTPDEHLDDLTPIEWLRSGNAGALVAQMLEGEARA